MTGKISRRALLRISATGAAGALLAACGTAPTPAGQAGQTPEVAPAGATQAGVAATTAPAQGSGGKTLQFYIGFGAGGAPEQVEALKTLFAKFVASTSGVAAVEPLVVPFAEAPRKFQTMVAGGTPPDVITMGMSQWDFAAKGAFVDLRPYVERDKLDMSQWDQNAVDAYTVRPRGELLYGLPFGLNTMAMVYNKTLFDKAGVAPPPKDWKDASWTWDAFVEKTTKLTSGEGPAKTWGTTGIGGNWILPWVFGGSWVDGAGKQIVVTQEQALKGFQFNYDLIHKYKVMPTQAEAQALANGFLSGKVGIYTDGTWAAGTLAKITDFEWDIAPVPYATGTDINRRATPYYPDALVISSANARDESWELVKFLVMNDEHYKEYLTIMSQVPARKPLRDWFQNEFWKKEKPNINWNGFLDGFNYAQVLTLFLNINWSELNNTQQSDLDTLWLDQTTPDKAVPALATKLQDIWQRGLTQLPA